VNSKVLIFRLQILGWDGDGDGEISTVMGMGNTHANTQIFC